MKTLIINKIYTLIATACIVGMLAACDTDGEETMSWKAGTGLHIVGPDEIIAGDEEEYYVDGFTINETYTWTLDGLTITPERKGEFVTLMFDDAGTHQLTVSNGTLSGALEITVEEE
jgi:hypothetical protein